MTHTAEECTDIKVNRVRAHMLKRIAKIEKGAPIDLMTQRLIDTITQNMSFLGFVWMTNNDIEEFHKVMCPSTYDIEL